MAKTENCRIAGVRVEIMTNGSQHVAGYHHHNDYLASGKLEPVVPIGRKNSQAEVAATVFVYIDLPFAMSKEESFNGCERNGKSWPGIVNHPKFALYHDLMKANPYGREGAGNVTEYLSKIAELEAKIAALESVTGQEVDQDEEEVEDHEAEEAELTAEDRELAELMKAEEGTASV